MEGCGEGMSTCGGLSDSGVWKKATSSKFCSISNEDAVLAQLPSSSSYSQAQTKVGRWETLVYWRDSGGQDHNGCPSLGLTLRNVHDPLATESLEALICD